MRKKFFFIGTAALMAIAATMIYGTSPKKTSIPFDSKAASRHLMNGTYANKFIEAFRVERDKINSETADFPIAETFNRDAIAGLLNVAGAESVAIYLAKNEKGEITFVLKPVDKKGNDIKASITGTDKNLTEGNVISLGRRCPPNCDPPPPPPTEP